MTTVLRESPRMSVSKLSEYIVARPSRRRSIVKDQKRPRDVIVARYRDVYPAVVQLLEGQTSPADLKALISELRSRDAASEWQTQDNALSADALEAFLGLDFALDEYRVSGWSLEGAAIAIGEVRVSVRPEIFLVHLKSGRRGAVKLYLSKTNALTNDAGIYAATLVHALLRDVHSFDDAKGSDCMVVDVFAGRVHSASARFKRRMQDIEAACEEISRAWPGT